MIEATTAGGFVLPGGFVFLVNCSLAGKLTSVDECGVCLDVVFCKVNGESAVEDEYDSNMSPMPGGGNDRRNNKFPSQERECC